MLRGTYRFRYPEHPILEVKVKKRPKALHVVLDEAPVDPMFPDSSFFFEISPLGVSGITGKTRNPPVLGKAWCIILDRRIDNTCFYMVGPITKILRQSEDGGNFLSGEMIYRWALLPKPA